MEQYLAFNKEILALKDSKELSKNSDLKSLNPFFDGDELLRVGRRLKNANIQYIQIPANLITSFKINRINYTT